MLGGTDFVGEFSLLILLIRLCHCWNAHDIAPLACALAGLQKDGFAFFIVFFCVLLWLRSHPLARKTRAGSKIPKTTKRSNASCLPAQFLGTIILCQLKSPNLAPTEQSSAGTLRLYGNEENLHRNNWQKKPGSVRDIFRVWKRESIFQVCQSW